MHKSSEMWLVILAVLAVLGVYQALFPVSAFTAFTRFLGLAAFFLLCVSLLVGPLAAFWPSKYAQLIEPRRAVGIAAFLFLAAHALLVTWVGLKFDFGIVASNPPLLAGSVAVVITFLLAATSTNFAVRKLGVTNWKNLQRLTYVAFVLSFAHFLFLANGLLAQKDGVPFLNLAEAALVLLGGITVIAQLAGAYRKMTSKLKTLDTK